MYLPMPGGSSTKQVEMQRHSAWHDEAHLNREYVSAYVAPSSLVVVGSKHIRAQSPVLQVGGDGPNRTPYQDKHLTRLHATYTKHTIVV